MYSKFEIGSNKIMLFGISTSTMSFCYPVHSKCLLPHPTSLSVEIYFDMGKNWGKVPLAKFLAAVLGMQHVNSQHI
jgi:hypothetical protein